MSAVLLFLPTLALTLTFFVLRSMSTISIRCLCSSSRRGVFVRGIPWILSTSVTSPIATSSFKNCSTVSLCPLRQA
ncbi:uncharacterized protein BDW47DRAFT_109610 [Aspergillus candidus]|uniref:Secreted protein n=1 Tax=Aspergillus candidus TaxID=41067 RepID=A0A2I2F5G4_ASPCN|nr:hypothetical protein BDW47DRAFT_109610 [Aspergillus candidus]PLB35851.1 hypothetical protein BDW47DRAFT_109610 [Aspergillus candidus]